MKIFTWKWWGDGLLALFLLLALILAFPVAFGITVWTIAHEYVDIKEKYLEEEGK